MIPSVPEALRFTESSNAYRRSGAFDKELQQISSRGLLNRATNAFPFELHRYQFCGQGTRFSRGDQGINSLDAACHEHDIVYSHSDLAERKAANNILAENARKHTASDSTLREREPQPQQFR